MARGGATFRFPLSKFCGTPKMLRLKTRWTRRLKNSSATSKFAANYFFETKEMESEKAFPATGPGPLPLLIGSRSSTRENGNRHT